MPKRGPGVPDQAPCGDTSPHAGHRHGANDSISCPGVVSPVQKKLPPEPRPDPNDKR
jgi:hypothetical protein